MKRIISLILILVIICLSISPVLADDEEEPVSFSVNESVMAYYIWLMLSSWGISIGTSTPASFNYAVEDAIIGWVLEYLDQLPSAYTISTWIAPWQASMDYWGNFQGNSSMLEDVNDFAEWLVDWLSLDDNDEFIVNPVVTVDDIQLYEFDTYYTTDMKNGQDFLVYMDAHDYNGTNIADYWFVAYEPYRNEWYAITIGLTSGNLNMAPRYYLASGVLDYSDSGLVYQDQGPTNHGYYYTAFRSKYLRGIPAGATYYQGTWSEFQVWIDDAVISRVGDVAVITGTIGLPADDPDYSEGDSIIIIGDEPTYTINFPDDMKVSNLPAIISQGAVPDPHFSGVFAPVSALITAMVPAITIVQGIAFELPDIVITFFLSMCGCLIFFGFVRKMIGD